MVDGERSSPDDQESVSIDSKIPGLDSTLDPDSANDSPQENHHD